MSKLCKRAGTTPNFITPSLRNQTPLYKLHKQLDVLVLQAYSFSLDDDLLEKLLDLNLDLAEKEKRGESVIGPWDPTKENP